MRWHFSGHTSEWSDGCVKLTYKILLLVLQPFYGPFDCLGLPGWAGTRKA